MQLRGHIALLLQGLFCLLQIVIFLEIIFNSYNFLVHGLGGNAMAITFWFCLGSTILSFILGIVSLFGSGWKKKLLTFLIFIGHTAFACYSLYYYVLFLVARS